MNNKPAQDIKLKTKISIGQKVSLITVMISAFCVGIVFTVSLFGQPGKIIAPTIPISKLSSQASANYYIPYDYIKLSVDSTIHDDYGLTYPATYQFAIPSDAIGLTAQKWDFEHDEWVNIQEKTSADTFNGIEAVRFDYEYDKTYVSIAFADNSDEIHLRFKDATNLKIDVTYQGITRYYDNRQAAVVATADDWGRADEDEVAFQTACDAFTEDQLWLTVGLITQGHDLEGDLPPDWLMVQEKIDQGFVEAASHSRNHPTTPYSNYDAEIGGSKQDIIDNLDLPYSRAGQEFVYSWIEPHGRADDTVRAKLGEYEYLSDRQYLTAGNDYKTWDGNNGLYNRAGMSIEVGQTTIGGCDWCTSCISDLATLNNQFDTVYEDGLIYHLAMHPRCVDWTAGSYAQQHLDYIKNRSDIWYVGFGYLYAYHFIQERNAVTVEKAGAPSTLVYFVRKWGSSGWGDGKFTDPSELAINETLGLIYVVDTFNNRIQAFDGDGVFQFKWGELGEGYAQFKYPKGLAINSDTGFIYVADTDNSRVQVFNENGDYQTSWGELGSGSGQFNKPESLEVVNSKVYVADTQNHRIQSFDLTGNYIAQWGEYGTEQAQFKKPRGITASYNTGLIYIADTENSRIQVFDQDGNYQDQFGAGGSWPGYFSQPYGIFITDDKIYVADSHNNRVQAFDINETFRYAWGGYGLEDGNFKHPVDIAVYNDEIYVLDQQNRRVQVFNLSECGDVNHSGNVDIDDIVYLVEYIFSGGPAPDPLMIGDADASGNVDIDDVMYIVNYIFAGGPEPNCGSRATLAPDPTGGWTLGEVNQYIEDIK